MPTAPTRPPAVPPSACILLAAENAIESAGLRAMLEEGTGWWVEEVWDSQHLSQALQAQRPDALVLDERLPDASGTALIQRLREDPQYASVPIVLLLPVGSGTQHRLAALRAGASDCLTRPFDPLELRLRVRALLARQVPEAERVARPRGTVVAVFNLRGGAGKTTLAINLALALTQTGSQVALVDMDLARGEVAVALHLPTAQTLADLREEELAEPTPASLQRASCLYKAGLVAFPARGSPQEAEEKARRIVSAVLPALQDLYACIVVDAPSDLDEGTLELLDMADQIVVPLTPDLASIHTTARVLEVFRSLGYEKPVHLVCNRVGAAKELTRAQVEEGLGGKEVLEVPHEPQAPRALSLHRPLAEEQPDSPAVRAIQRLAQRIREAESLSRRAQEEAERVEVPPALLPGAEEEAPRPRRISRRTLLPLAALMALVALLIPLAFVLQGTGQGASVQVGDPAPPFTLPLVGGGEFSLGEKAGQVRVLTFWHTRDALCRHQAVILAWGHRTYGPRGVAILGIDPRDDEDRVRALLEGADRPPGLEGPFPVALDPRGEVTARFGVQKFPTTFFVDGQGEVVARYEGLVTQRQFLEELERLGIAP
ncbi:MAG: redoxin domain-containing protein [Anaerolineae bacterium]